MFLLVEDVGVRAIAHHGEKIGWKPRQPGAVRCEMLEGDVRGNVRVFWETLADGIVEFDTAILDKLGQRDGSEGFGDRTDFVNRRAVRRRLVGKTLHMLT